MTSQQIIDGIETAALECPLCLERFTNPKSLPCIHSFCLECLEKWVKERNGILSCPTCREDCQIPKDGLKKLQNNIFIIGLLDYVATLEQKSAPACGCAEEACYFCRECDELYCIECKGAHTRMKISKNHSIITLKEYTAIDPVERFALKSLNCSEHNMPLQFFCESCKKPVCVGCTLVEHPKGDDHNIVDVKNAFRAFVTHASDLIETSDKKLLSFHNITKQVKVKMTAAMSNDTKCRVAIRRQSDDLHRLIDHLKHEQLEQLDSCHQNKMKLLESQVRDLELSIAKLSSMRGITHNLASSPNQVMALMSSSGVSERLNELLKEEHVNVEARELAAFEYNPINMLSKLGKAVGLYGLELSPEKSKLTIVYDYFQVSSEMFFRQSKSVIITTRNGSGKTVYTDAKVKCLQINQINDINMNDRKKKNVLLSATDNLDGSYQINSDTPFKRCWLICLIFIGFDVYINDIEFDSIGYCPFPESAFKSL